jgi:hypothetical protein
MTSATCHALRRDSSRAPVSRHRFALGAGNRELDRTVLFVGVNDGRHPVRTRRLAADGHGVASTCGSYAAFAHARGACDGSFFAITLLAGDPVENGNTEQDVGVTDCEADPSGFALEDHEDRKVGDGGGEGGAGADEGAPCHALEEGVGVGLVRVQAAEGDDEEKG